jgi:hypothetical protein
MGDHWVHLRMCLVCGHVACCDSSKNKHATKHFHTTGHPLMRSIELGEQWGLCYLDKTMKPRVFKNNNNLPQSLLKLHLHAVRSRLLQDAIKCHIPDVSSTGAFRYLARKRSAKRRNPREPPPDA